MSFETKTSEMKTAIDDLSMDTFGVKTSDSIKGKMCVFCKQEATEFKDELSRREFGISGICQVCQDEVFG